MPTANIGDVSLFYEETGQGEPVLLLPPSWWPAATWNVGVVPALSQRYHTIIFDCRGTGHSSKPKEGYTVQQFAQDGIALLSHLKISRCHVVGFALGGQIVQAMAIARPDLIASLTMAAAGPGSKTLSGGPRDFSPEAAHEIREMGFERYIKTHINNDGMAFNPDFYRAHRDVADALAKAAEVKVPTLILCGADDDVNRRGSTPVGTACRLGELVPGAELALVPGVKHMTFWDGDGGLKGLQNFLTKHPIR